MSGYDFHFNIQNELFLILSKRRGDDLFYVINPEKTIENFSFETRETSKVLRELVEKFGKREKLKFEDFKKEYDADQILWVWNPLLLKLDFLIEYIEIREEIYKLLYDFYSLNFDE